MRSEARGPWQLQRAGWFCSSWERVYRRRASQQLGHLACRLYRSRFSPVPCWLASLLEFSSLNIAVPRASLQWRAGILGVRLLDCKVCVFLRASATWLPRDSSNPSVPASALRASPWSSADTLHGRARRQPSRGTPQCSGALLN